MPSTVYPFTIRDRMLISRGVKRHVLQTSTLPDILSLLKRIEGLASPADVPITLDRVKVDFTGRSMTATIGSNPQVYNLMTTGAGHLASDVLPNRFWTGFRELALKDARVARSAWEVFSRELGKTKRVIRTQHIRYCRQCGTGPSSSCAANGHTQQIRPVIRAVVSTKYALYSNVQMVEDLLSSSTAFAKMPVLSWYLGDAGIRIRFLGLDPATAAFAAFDPEAVLMNRPLPMVEISNSEVKRGAIRMAGGLWNLRTASGLGHWDENTAYRWNHTGATSRVTSRVRGAFGALTATATAVIQAYDDAGNIDIEDPEAWLKKHLPAKGKNKVVTQRVLDAALAALNDPDVTPGGKLASVVDAITIAAAGESDVYTASDVEKAASRLMRRGLDIAAKNGGKIQ
jgi:hypothetical protein